MIFVGVQATGKSTFFKQRFYRSHVRISYDMLKTRRKESLLLEACWEMPHRFVVDNTNPERSDRDRYILGSKRRGFKIVGYSFRSMLEEASRRNEERPDQERIPEAGLRGAAARLELSSYAEGYDRLYYVALGGAGNPRFRTGGSKRERNDWGASASEAAHRLGLDERAQ